MHKVDRVITLVGEQAEPHLDALSNLRSRVFRAWPYLYECDVAYEHEYLEVMFGTQDAVLVLAMDGDKAVGASTGLPLNEEHDEFIQPFIEQGIDPARVFYLAESVLLSAYRSQGIGHRFFDEREAHVLRLHQEAIDAGNPAGRFDYLTFAGVIRDSADPRRPRSYRELAPFWRKRRYKLQPELVANYAWRDIGEIEKTSKPMQFWTRPMSELLA